VLQKENHPLPPPGKGVRGEQRGVLELEIRLPRKRPSLLMLATQLESEERQQIQSAQQINRLAAAHPEMPALLAGDLNDLRDSRTLRQLAKEWSRVNAKEMPTAPAQKPQSQLDYVLYRPANRWRVVEVRVLDEATASDHRPLLAVLELLHAPGE
jgi:endonuclease/exonuclease/phosphatase family metal-dependent hydrolase